ncbi:hypothetical protein BC629DRAFT_931270 [Irpex lacteus]|nr:hypothetical protein BC629DRAFT_931270 [Irpex lacteus]
MKIDNMECHVVCDDQNLVEYQEKSEANPKSCQCYIISETGKRFLVRVLRSSAPQTDLAAHLWVDGQCMRKRVLAKENSLSDIDAARIDASTLRPFIFTSIVLTDDDRVLQEGSFNANDLGTICLKIYRIKYHGPSTRYITDKANVDNIGKPVHEKSKKAGGHRVTFVLPSSNLNIPTFTMLHRLGEAKIVEAKLGTKATWIDEINSPYCTFTWRYRSKDILQAQGIVPLDPAPLPLKRPGSPVPSGSSSKRPRTEQSPSQQGSSSQVKLEDVSTAQERQARVEALRAQLEEEEAALKEELRRENAAGVKREVSPIVLKGGSGDIIDLTEDD